MKVMKVLLERKITFVGTTYFYGNRGFEGGAIESLDNSLSFLGTGHFERSWAIQGGAVFMEGTSRLVFKPKLNISFISNHANESGGALYFSDSQCSLGSTAPIECFITIDGPSVSTNNISLHFESNSAGFAGSIPYGGQFNKCRLFFKTITRENPDLFGCQANDYSDNALEIFKNTSTTAQNEDTVQNISSPAKEIRFCEVNNSEIEMRLYPGQHFYVSLIALGQVEYPIPTTIFGK